MGEVVVNSTVVVRFKLSRFDRFEARNRPHLHILVRNRQTLYDSANFKLIRIKSNRLPKK